MAEVEWYGCVGLGRPRSQSRRDVPVLNIRLGRPPWSGEFYHTPAATTDIFVEELVVLVFELQRILVLIASTSKLKAVARLALRLRLVAFNAALLTCHAASGASTVDHRDTPKGEILLR
jgi:hypothetical protein